MNQIVYNFRTTAVNENNVAAKRVPCKSGFKGVSELIKSVKDKNFDASNWDELKAIERTILAVGKEAEMVILTTESSYYGKKYKGIMYN